MTAKRPSWFQQWLPFLVTMGFQIIGGVTFAIHISDQGAQNTKEIAEIKLVLVPRPEIEQQKIDTKDELRSIEGKLDILLTRREDPQ